MLQGGAQAAVQRQREVQGPVGGARLGTHSLGRPLLDGSGRRGVSAPACAAGRASASCSPSNGVAAARCVEQRCRCRAHHAERSARHHWHRCRLPRAGCRPLQLPSTAPPPRSASNVRPVDVLVENFEAAYNGNRAVRCCTQLGWSFPAASRGSWCPPARHSTAGSHSWPPPLLPCAHRAPRTRLSRPAPGPALQPLPIYIHTPWLRTGQRLTGLQLFAGARRAGQSPVRLRPQRAAAGASRRLCWVACVVPPPLPFCHLSTPTLPANTGPRCRVCAGQAGRLLCHHAPADRIHAEPGAGRPDHAADAGQRQRGRRGAGGRAPVGRGAQAASASGTRRGAAGAGGPAAGAAASQPQP